MSESSYRVAIAAYCCSDIFSAVRIARSDAGRRPPGRGPPPARLAGRRAEDTPRAPSGACARAREVALRADRASLSQRRRRLALHCRHVLALAVARGLRSVRRPSSSPSSVARREVAALSQFYRRPPRRSASRWARNSSRRSTSSARSATRSRRRRCCRTCSGSSASRPTSATPRRAGRRCASCRRRRRTGCRCCPRS